MRLLLHGGAQPWFFHMLQERRFEGCPTSDRLTRKACFHQLQTWWAQQHTRSRVPKKSPATHKGVARNQLGGDWRACVLPTSSSSPRGFSFAKPAGVPVIATAHIRERLGALGNPIDRGIALGDNCDIHHPICVLDKTGQPVKIVDTVGHNCLNLQNKQQKTWMLSLKSKS
jgi:hypothetical protein